MCEYGSYNNQSHFVRHVSNFLILKIIINMSKLILLKRKKPYIVYSGIQNKYEVRITSEAKKLKN